MFSPDGTQIAFRRRLPGATARGNFDIFAINADGQNLRQLTDDAANDQDPSWSPDGASIAFVSERADGGGSGPSRLWVMDSAGNDERRLLTDDERLRCQRRPGRVADASGRRSADRVGRIRLRLAGDCLDDEIRRPRVTLRNTHIDG